MNQTTDSVQDPNLTSNLGAEDDSSDQDWISLSEDEPLDPSAEAGGVEEPIVEEKGVAEVPVEGASGSSTPPLSVAPGSEEPASPAAPPQAQPPVQAQEPQQPVEQQQTVSPEDRARQLSEQRQKFVAELERQYQFSEDDAEMLISSPEKVLPKAMAAMHANLLEAMTYGLMQQLPQVVGHVLEQRQAVQSAEQKFFSRWDKLNTPQGRQMVQRMGAAWRQVNPTASEDEFITQVGAAVSVALGVPPSTEPSTPPAAVHRPPPPAAPGGSTPVPKPSQPTNAFAQLAEEFLSGDD